MAKKQTSAKVSKIAATYIKLTDGELDEMMANRPHTLISVVRMLAASCLAQDETTGEKKPKTKKAKNDGKPDHA